MTKCTNGQGKHLKYSETFLSKLDEIENYALRGALISLLEILDKSLSASSTTIDHIHGCMCFVGGRTEVIGHECGYEHSFLIRYLEMLNGKSYYKITMSTSYMGQPHVEYPWHVLAMPTHANGKACLRCYSVTFVLA